MSRRAQYVVGFVLGVVLVGWFLRRADLTQVAVLIRGADARFVGLACLTVGFTSLQRAWRWRRLLGSLGSFRITDLWATIAMGWTVSVLLPGRLGEIARPWLLAQRTPVDASAALGSVVLERIFDVVAILCLLAGYLVLAPPAVGLSPDGAATLGLLRTVGVGLLSALVALGVVAMLVARSSRIRERAATGISGRLPARLARLVTSFLRGMSELRSARAVAQILLSSIMLWGTVVLTYVLLFEAMALDVEWYGAIPLLTLLVVGAAVPTPAGVGAFHKVAQIGLVGLFGVPNDAAVAYAIVSHAVAFLPLAAVGLALLIRAGMAGQVLRDMGSNLAASE